MNRYGLCNKPASKLGFFLALIWVLGESIADGDKSGAPAVTGNLRSEFLSRPCSFAIEDEEEALARAEDDSIPGSVIRITNTHYGRLGNHFTIVYRFLATGYCCKSKLVTLPPKDPQLAPGIFGRGTAGPRHFDFSEAPDVPGFNSSSCGGGYTIGGKRAFDANKRASDGRAKNEPLTACIEKTRVLECEAAYYFPTDVDICDNPYSAMENVGMNLSGEDKAEHLVVHVRSGDIFTSRNARGRYGQPPLSFYTTVLNSRSWKQADIVTHALSGKAQNPVLAELQIMSDNGSWPRTDVNIYMKRDFGADLQAMLCADALVTSKSTLGALTMHHTRARTVFIPCTCEGTGAGFGPTPRYLVGDRTKREKNFEVVGIVLKPDAPQYGVYNSQKNYDDAILRLDMLKYQGIADLEVCT